MMRFTHPLLEQPILVEETTVQIVVLEHPTALRDTQKQIQLALDKEESKCTLSVGFEPVGASKYMDLLMPPFGVDVNSRKVLSKLHEELASQVYQEDWYMKTNELKANVEQYLCDVSVDCPLPITYDEVQVEMLFKAVNLRLEVVDNVVESLCDYMDIMQNFFGVAFFVAFHLKDYLSVEELAVLYQHCQYKKYSMLLFESHVSDLVGEEKRVAILDKDMCEIP